jgi:thiamine pyrophosphate-dependent acetolactate synthase large subunit-like protein
MIASPATRPSSRVRRARIAHLDVDRAEINKVKPPTGATSGLLPDALRAIAAAVAGGRSSDYAAWHAHLARCGSATR